MHQVRDPTLQAKAGMSKAEWKKKVCMRVSIRVCSSVPGGAAWHTTGGVLVCAGMFTTARISACGQGRVWQGVLLYELRACACVRARCLTGSLTQVKEDKAERRKDKMPKHKKKFATKSHKAKIAGK